MLVISAFCETDYDMAVQLHAWIHELDTPTTRHELLLVASSGITQEQTVDLSNIARKHFPKFTAIRQNGIDPKKWPQGPNSMFRTATDWVKKNNKGGFLWLENDVAPIVPGWLDKLEEDYQAKGKPFYGALFDKPWRHLNGVMLYPPSIGRFNPHMLGASERSFDLIKPEINLKFGHVTNLIQRSLADPKQNLKHTFHDQQSLSIIHPQCVLFHGCDSTLIPRLRERRGGVLPARKRSASGFNRIRNTVKTFFTPKTTRTTTYYHTGNLGDIIYALAAIRLHGGGDLVIGPRHPQTDPCSMPVSREQFNRLLPLLSEQPYIRSARWTPNYPQRIDHDLNRFRNSWFNLDLRIQTGANSLCAMHCHTLEVLDQFDEKESWLTVPKEKNGRIIIARSLRHRSWDFPYDQVIKQFGEDCLFVGLEQEKIVFDVAWPKVEFRPVQNFFEMAQIIAGSSGMAANQSFPCSLAIGLGVPLWQEVYHPAPDCLFKRKNFFTQKNTIQEFARVAK